MSFPPSHPALDRALAARGYETPTSVQSAVLEADPAADLLVSAQTGSGKTVAFGLAMASTLLGVDARFGAASKPLALIIAPTRELAVQISRELSWLYAETGARIVECVGGMDIRREQRLLGAGCHIVVGTPGRLRDHLEREYLDLAGLKVAVLDEADEMLDLGFREELEAILDATPEARRTLLFSATIAKDIAALARRYQRDAARIDTTSRDQPHGDIEYRAMRVAPHDIERAVVNVLRYFEAPRALVFCKTREAVRHLHASLRERGFSVVGLSGELSQRERTDALQSLRDGHSRVCVATDVAARGLDLPDLGIVIHADPPTNKADLLHRSGRTGRAGRKGVSVLMVTHSKRKKIEQILGAANINALWSGPPTAEEIRAQDRTRLLDDPIFAEQPSEEDLALAKLVMEKLSPEQIAATLMRLRRAEHPEPEDVGDDTRMRDSQATTRERAERPEREPREPREPRTPFETPNDNAWFSINAGRRKNAEPRWLVPFICRFGNVTKKDIGPIRIFEDETKFAILGDSLADFTAAVAVTTDSDMRITPSTPPGARPPPYERKREERKPRDKFDAMANDPQREPRREPRAAEQRSPHPRREDRPAKPPHARPSWRDVAQEVQQAEAPSRDTRPDKGLRQRDRKKLAKLAQSSDAKPAEFVKPPRHAERPHGKHPGKFAGKHPGAKRVEETAHRGKPHKGKSPGAQSQHKSEGKRRWQP
jgi:ATP-dependent RNA helicase DeaD